MGRTNQGGSVLSFILIGGVLVLLFVAGAFVINQTTTQTKQPPAPVPAAPDVSQDDTDSEAPARPTPAPETPTTPAQPDTPPAQELPQTGPRELAGSVIALALLSGATASYLQSRRYRISL